MNTPAAEAIALEERFAVRRVEASNSTRPGAAADVAVFTVAGAAARIRRTHPKAHTMCISSHIDGRQVTFDVFGRYGALLSGPGDGHTDQLQTDLGAYGRNLPATALALIEEASDAPVSEHGFARMYARIDSILIQAELIPTPAVI